MQQSHQIHLSLYTQNINRKTQISQLCTEHDVHLSHEAQSQDSWNASVSRAAPLQMKEELIGQNGWIPAVCKSELLESHRVIWQIIAELFSTTVF